MSDTYKTAKLILSPQWSWIKYAVVIISTAREVMKLIVAIFMCHSTVGLTHCYKTAVFYIYICSF